MTQGRAIYTMELSHYDETPKSVADQIIEKIKGKEAVQLCLHNITFSF